MPLLHSSPENHKRQGIIAPLSAVLMVFLLGMVAFTVDIAWMVLAQTELQNVADSAALAGAQPLMDQYVNYALAKLSGQGSPDTILATAMSKAKDKAKELAAANVFRGSKGSETPYVLADADIEFGTTDDKNVYTKAPGGVFPNTIKVTMRRSGDAAALANGTANGSLGLFFGPVLGTSSVDLNVMAAATMYGVSDTIDSLVTPAALLPLTFDMDFWDKFWKDGSNPDGQVVKDDNGVPKLLIYPTNKYKGNFGLLSLNDSNIDANSLKGWVDNGISADDLNTLINNKLIPISKHDDKKFDWAGAPGFKSTLVQTVNEHIDKISLLPLFKAKTGMSGGEKDYQAGEGKGSNYDYKIVGFAPVKIVSTPGDNREIYIQPAAYIASDETVMTTFQNAGKFKPLDTSNPSASTIFTYPKLTR